MVWRPYGLPSVAGQAMTPIPSFAKAMEGRLSGADDHGPAKPDRGTRTRLS